MPVLDRPSPNFGPRRDGGRPELVVLHYTGMRTSEAALDRLCDPAAEVSAHYLISERGAVWRLVAENARAWHAGAGQWAGRGDVNSRSIGIELANPGPLCDFPPFPEPQMLALEDLLAGICERWGIGPSGVIGHSDMAPARKSDPGPKFDWRRLARRGLALWPEPGPTPAGGADWDTFIAAATAAGYRADGDDWGAVLRAVRLRWRPWATSETPDLADVARLAAVRVDAGDVPSY